MTARVIRFPPRRSSAIWILREGPAWLVLAPRGYGWLYGDRASALQDAHWLSQSLGAPIREVA
jgi:hypothetical protein